MKIMLFLVLITYSFYVNARSSLNPQDLSSLEGRQVLCQILNKMHLNLGGDVWPGFDPIETPLVVKFRDGIFGFGDLSTKKQWQKKSVGSCDLYLAPEGFEAPSAPIVPYFDVSGTKAFYFDITIVPKLSAWLLSAVIHERFHRFQWEHFSYIMKLLSAKFSAFTSPGAGAQALIENDSLTSYLKLGNETSLSDFVAVSLIRESSLSIDESADWELGQQIAEGTATYVQLAAMRLIESDLSLNFEKTWREHLIDDLSQSQGTDGLIKWRHYAVGGIVFEFLNRKTGNMTWATEIQNGQVLSVFRLLLPFISNTEPWFILRGQTMLKSEAGFEALANAEQMVNDYLSAVKKTTSQIDLASFKVSIGSPGAKQCSGGGVSQRMYYLPLGGTLATGYSGGTKCGYGSFVLNFINEPVLLLSAEGITTFGSENLRIWIGGTEFSSSTQGSSEFSGLKLESVTMNFQTTKSGTLTIIGNSVEIKFKDENGD